MDFLMLKKKMENFKRNNKQIQKIKRFQKNKVMLQK